MSQKTFSLIAGVLFSLIALGHLVRLGLSVEWMVAGRVIPMWPSVVAVVIGIFIGYQGFRLSAKG